MKTLKNIAAQLTAITFILAFLFACNGQFQDKHISNQEGKESILKQPKGGDSITKSLDKNIRSIFQDKHGHYWIGTNGAGVYRYDSKGLTQFTVKDGLSDNQVNNIQEDELGNIWFGTGSFGVCAFDGTQFTIATTKVEITEGTETDWKSKANDLWFCAGAGVFRYSHSSLDYLPLATSGSTTQTFSPFSLSRSGVYSILKDSKGNIWFGTQAEGVCRYDGKTRTWFKEKGLSDSAVLGLFEDRKGNLWIGNNGAGLFRYDGKTLTNFTEENSLGNPDFKTSGKPGVETMARVYTINEDNNGNIWVGTVDAGVWKYDGHELTHYTAQDGLTSNAVNTIYKDKNGELWFGTDENGICQFNGTSFTEFIIK